MQMIRCDVNQVIGRGTFATVFRGTLVEEAGRTITVRRTLSGTTQGLASDSGKPVAVKRIQLTDVVSGEHEENALRRLLHPNVVKLLRVESDSNFRYYALELCLASLDQYFLGPNDENRYKGPPLPSEFTVLLELAQGLAHIHGKQLIHRDIKPNNILIFHDPSTNEPVKMKWADFGLSRPVNIQGSFTMSGTRGTFRWMAPELLKLMDQEEERAFQGNNGTRSNENNALRGNLKSDIFSEGCVFGYFILGGKHPYGSTEVNIMMNIRRNNAVSFNSYHNHYAYPIIKGMLEEEKQRITSSDVVEMLLKTQWR